MMVRAEKSLRVPACFASQPLHESRRGWLAIQTTATCKHDAELTRRPQSPTFQTWH